MGALERRSLEWMDDAPVRVSVTRHIDASAADVFAVLADHETWPEWFGSLESVEVTGAASGVGAERRVMVKGLGGFDEEFIAWEPGEAFGFAVLAMDRPIMKALNELVTIEPDGDGVSVTYIQAFDPKWWLLPVWKLAAKTSLPRAVGKGLDGLAERVTSA
jgi:uncharacterized protein YndB with AHSA1/START domain